MGYGVCILPGFADGESDHVLRLHGILSGHYNADLGRKITWIFPVSNVDNRQVWVGNRSAVDYSTGYKRVKLSSDGTNTASKKFVDGDIPAARGGILAWSVARPVALLTLAFLLAAWCPGGLTS